jgi:hypothetical protein
MTPEQAADLQPGQVIEWHGVQHRLGTVTTDRTRGGEVLKVAAYSLTAETWLRLVPRREPGLNLDPADAAALAAARLVEPAGEGPLVRPLTLGEADRLLRAAAAEPPGQP